MVVALIGDYGVGKTTIAQYLVKKHGFKKLSFARPLKQIAAKTLGVSVTKFDSEKFKNENLVINGVVHEMTNRDYLNSLSKYLRSTLGDDYFVRLMEDAYKKDFETKNVVIDDLRYLVEEDLVQKYKGVQIKIITENSGDDGYELSKLKYNYEIKNEYNYEVFEKVYEVIKNPLDVDVNDYKVT